MEDGSAWRNRGNPSYGYVVGSWGREDAGTTLTFSGGILKSACYKDGAGDVREGAGWIFAPITVSYALCVRCRNTCKVIT